METIKMTKLEALTKYLGVSVDDVEEHDNTFEHGNREYLVLTDSEADEYVKERIKESVWAFNSSFLADGTDLPEEVFKAMQGKCEDSNEAVLKLIEKTWDGGFDGFVDDAISSDGRGHFMSSYDGEENEDGEFYIYRTN